jgi:threonine dehydrogenase-like Zn-dependent dehydrogenase
MPGIDLRIAERNEVRRRFAGKIGYRTESVAEEEFDLAFDASGSAAGLQEAIDRVGTEGRVVEVSWFGADETPLRLGGSFHIQRKSLIASQVSRLPAFQTPRWDRIRRKQLVFSLLRDPTFDILLNEPIPFEKLPGFFNRPHVEGRAIVPLVGYS